MRILIVCRDLTEASYLDELRANWVGHDLAPIAVADFDIQLLAECDAIVLAGDPNTDTDIPLEPLSALTNLVLDPPMPMLGIGWGFDLVCLANGDDLPEIATKIEGAIRMEPKGKGGEALFQGSDPVRINPVQRWDLDEVPRGWAVLARSETGVEAFQHKQRPVTAIQQLPADFTYPSDAKLVYQNLLSLLAKRG